MDTTMKHTDNIPLVLKIIIPLLLFAGLGFSQEKSVDYFEWRIASNSVTNPDKIALCTIAPAYVARFYDNYLPWWQADLLAFSTTVLWEIKDGLIPEEKQGFLGGEGFSKVDLKYGAIGIGLNRVLPVIVNQVIKIIKPDRKNRVSLSIDSKHGLKLGVSLKL